MATRRRSLGERSSQWSSLVTNGKKFAADIPQAVPDLQELEKIAAEIRKLSSEQDRLTGLLRSTTSRIRKLGREADRLRGRIGASLRGRYGFDAPVLIQYGFKPRRSRRPLSEPPERPLDTTPAEIAADGVPQGTAPEPEPPETDGGRAAPTEEGPGA